MTTSPDPHPAEARARTPLRLELGASSDGRTHGTWWPQSRDLQVEVADLVDHFPPKAGYINRLLFSRPDWDDTVTDGRGIRRIHARRGPVKVGSFPGDDTHLMVLSMATGERLKLVVVGDTAAEADSAASAAIARWDDESPAH